MGAPVAPAEPAAGQRTRLVAHPHPPLSPPGRRHGTARPGRAPDPRELEVLNQVAAMSSTEEVAVALSISTNTVKTHLLNLYRKLDVARRRDAVHRARDLGLL
ncbi:helix-turn-helix transcriptional regulator [Rhodococcus opacus]|nr:helix-turn-helix transcriptional regulator [Rhodococcus opacus]